MSSYQEFREDIINRINEVEPCRYYQEMKLRIIHIADDLLRQQHSISIKEYKACIDKAIQLYDYPSFLVGLHKIVNESYKEFSCGFGVGKL